MLAATLQDVGRLDVAVHISRLMQRSDSPDQLPDHLQIRIGVKQALQRKEKVQARAGARLRRVSSLSLACGCRMDVKHSGTRKSR